MKTFFTFLILCCVWFGSPPPVFAQNLTADTIPAFKPYKNSVYAELGGNGLFGSVNYERYFYTPYRPNSTVAMRLGLCYLPANKFTGKSATYITIPAEVSIFWGKKAVKPEIGFGFTLSQSAHRGDGYYSEEAYFEMHLFPMFRFGLRHEKYDKPVFWRLGFTPALIIADAGDPPQVFPWAGLSVGYKFGR